MSQEHVLPSLTASDIVSGGKYIIVRCDVEGIYSSLVIEVLTDPARDPDPAKQVFEAVCLMMDGQAFDDSSDSEPHLLTLTDIGCPRKGSVKGIPCRTFSFDEVAYDIIVGNVRAQPHVWRQAFQIEEINFAYRDVPEKSLFEIKPASPAPLSGISASSRLRTASFLTPA